MHVELNEEELHLLMAGLKATEKGQRLWNKLNALRTVALVKK
jgi:hypothetical protein